ncbi:hypothetical protein B0T11DRAFT_291481 [Plectosphaerella cucumerina]|uniref:T6SS Phospholipase effector Tle1-like catalytic domain-containing protein n=1 Tax=Plectosphaerella cucumerina TaxID=40658 RepID=A0A8K0WXX5_9PEZI|nr:hypothetical protein B0T11DRAFT_291481 [Plectosphaerella cucumerina]
MAYYTHSDLAYGQSYFPVYRPREKYMPRMTTDHTGPAPNGAPKRLICCCDGTWMDSLGEKSGEPQSNVTRISRVLRRTTSSGMHQIIAYNPGVGSGNVLDRVTGGMFGAGLEQVIRETYNFVCTNYVDGDEIVLIGYSRGAFTARSVADMIASLGLLTPAGLDSFYPIFEDYEHIGDSKRAREDFLCDALPVYGGEKGEAKLLWEAHRKEVYKEWLKSLGYTRDTHRDGTPITIKALAVWDTVGTLGVPPAPIIGIAGSSDQWKFTNTEISDKVENAFQALGLDEPRYAFRPALWERINGNTTNLKQVWFPGNHGGVGGGWHDQQMATISLAWMCDQLSSIGVEFNLARMTETFMDVLGYSAVHPFPVVASPSRLSSLASVLPFRRRGSSSVLPWGSTGVCRAVSPVRDAIEHDGNTCRHPTGPPEKLWATARPWALGLTRAPTGKLTSLGGSTIRTPGMFMRTDSDSNTDTDQPLLNTSERIHSSVRVRLACGGLGLDDKETWRCRGLAPWKLRPGPAGDLKAARPRELDLGYPEEYLYPVAARDGDWQWMFDKDEVHGTGHGRVPQVLSIPEEPLTGYWERYFLNLTAGHPDVWRYALHNPPRDG